MSFFLAVEGLDASGKHTQTEILKKYFEASYSVTKFEFPQYKSITGELIRDHLTGVWRAEMVREPEAPRKYSGDVGTYLFQCCQLVNRMETLPDELWDRHPGRVYIADRYNSSAYAYGLAFGLDFDWLVHTHRRLPQPDLNVFLDIPIEESFRRRPNRQDEYEKNAKLLERVRECYLEVFRRLGPSYVVIDGLGTTEQVTERILQHVQRIAT
jgi:dTMP kinase